MASKSRTRAREIALQALYQHDLAQRSKEARPHPVELEPFIRQSSDEPEVRAYALRLYDGTLSALEGIDAQIEAVVAHWKLERIAAVDRSVLRMALYEILDVPDVPPKVVINEAIELAKKYSTAESGAFVNGILDRIYRQLLQAPEEPARSPRG